MTLEQYFKKELADGKIEFRLRATDSGDGVDIYIHPSDRDGATTPNLRVQGNSISMAPGSSHPDWLVERHDQNGAAVIIPGQTLVYINGIPVTLAVDTIVETAYENMHLLTGYHYASLPAPPATPTPEHSK